MTTASITQTRLEKLLTSIASGYVWEPDELRVASIERGNGITLTIQSAGDDYALLIGQEGRNIKALSFLFSSIGHQYGRPISVILVEPRTPRVGGFKEITSNFQWDPEPTRKLIKSIVVAVCPTATVTYNCVGGWHLFQVAIPDDLKRFVTSLNTIMRATGKMHGVTIEVEAVDGGSSL